MKGLFQRFMARQEAQAVPDVAPAFTGDPVGRKAIESLVGHPVHDVDLYEQALRHRSLMRGDADSHLQSNERLEYLGDAVLGFVVAEYLFAAFPEEAEGYMTRLRAKLVSGTALAARARSMHLDRYLQTSDSVTDAQMKSSDSMLSDAFESVIGALYLDLGIEAARVFITRHVLEATNLADLAEQRQNHKSALLELLQSDGRPQPTYRVVGEEGPSHDKIFEVAVYVEGEEFGRATDRSKKRAEQAAAGIALSQLRSS